MERMEPMAVPATYHAASSSEHCSSTNEKQNVTVLSTEVPFARLPYHFEAGEKPLTPQTIFEKLWRVLTGRDKRANSWQPGFLQLRPLLGIFGLLFTLLCLSASLLVLKVSDGQATDDWKLEPTVYLAILTALGNSALVFSRSQAVPISWWYAASRGSSVRRLQRHWEVSHSLFRAILQLRNLSLLHITCIVCTIAIIDGALLQRSSNVARARVPSNITLDLVLPPELPQGFSGTLFEGVGKVTHTAAKTCIDWANDKPILYPTSQCVGTCRATVLGPGLVKRHCNPKKTWPVTLPMLSNMSASWGPWHGYGPLEGMGLVARNPVLNSLLVGSNSRDYGESLVLQQGIATWDFTTDKKTPGSYVYEDCIYGAGIVEYNVVIGDGTIAIVGDASQAPLVRLANNTKPLDWYRANVSQPSVFLQLYTWVQLFTQINASVVLGPEIGSKYYVADPGTWNRQAATLQLGNDITSMGFADPTPAVLSKMNEIIFRGAVLAGQTWSNISSLIDSDVSIHQSVQAAQIIDQNIYKSDLRYFAGAAVLQIAAVVLILQMFWGFWTLGMPMTLSPFDIALAFNAPLLGGINSTAGVAGIVEEVGDLPLTFGAVREGAEAGRLGLAEAEKVVQPQRGIVFER